jgi:hypothetical protein
MVCTICDFQFLRNNLQHWYLSDLHTYIVPGPSLFSYPIGHVKGLSVSSDEESEIVLATIAESPIYWSLCFGLMGLIFVTGLFLLWYFRGAFIGALKRRPASALPYVELGCSPRRETSRGLIADEQPSKACGSLLAAYHVCALFYILWIVWLLTSFRLDKIKDGSMMTFIDMTMMVSSHFEKSVPKTYHPRLVNVTRRLLPPGRHWIDIRDKPVFPAVHGDKRAFCAYNPSAPTCLNYDEPPPAPILSEAEMTNDVLIILESLTPSTYQLDDGFIDEMAQTKHGDPNYFITDSPLYNDEYAHYLRDLSRDGIAFSGANSLGLPTCSGWHGIMTGLTPSQNYLTILEGAALHVDDVPSHMRDAGFWTFYLSAEDFDFDGMGNCVWRRNATQEAKTRLHCADQLDIQDETLMSLLQEQYVKRVDCNTSKLKAQVAKLAKQLSDQDVPQAFDWADMYYPTVLQREFMNLTNTSMPLHNWVCDRVSSAQFRLHWHQQRETLKRRGLKKPIFAGYMNVDGHMPYLGYDFDDQYEKIGETASWDELKKARYLRVNKYADKYAVGDTINFLRKHAPNTIVVVTGDHGTRDIPIRSKNSKVTEKTVYSGDCVGGTSGGDSLFATSGVIAYLGKDDQVKKAMGLDRLRGKTVKFSTDHGDLMYTLFELVAKLQGKPMKPTHRRGRNLINLSLEILGKGYSEQAKILNASKWQSLSFLSRQIEYRKGAEMIRMNPADPHGAHYYNATVFPTCLKAVGDPDMPVGVNEDFSLYREAFDYLMAENFFTSWNRMYAYEFRDGKCIEQGNCSMPEPHPEVKQNQRGFLVFFVVIPGGFMMIVGGLLVLAYEIWRFFFEGKGEEQEEVLLDENEGAEVDTLGDYSRAGPAAGPPTLNVEMSPE